MNIQSLTLFLLLTACITAYLSVIDYIKLFCQGGGLEMGLILEIPPFFLPLPNVHGWGGGGGGVLRHASICDMYIDIGETIAGPPNSQKYSHCGKYLTW